MAYVGIDFDTRAVHLVKLEESGAATYTRCELTGADAFERTRAVRDAMPGSVFWEDVVACAIEEPMGHSTRPLNRVQGAILACLPRTLLVEPMMPARWRTVVGLPGNASKSAVAMLAWRHVSESAGRIVNVGDGSQDACDAYCLALAVSRLVETEAA